jgi:hypothetical protein
VSRVLPKDQAALRLWCHRRGRPHALGGGVLHQVRLPGSDFDRRDLEALGVAPEASGHVDLWMGWLRATFASAAHAGDEASNRGGRIDPGDDRSVLYAFPFSHEVNPSTGDAWGYGMPLFLDFGCPCGVYPESVPALYRSLEAGREVSLRSDGGEPHARAQVHPTTAAWSRLANLRPPKK